MQADETLKEQTFNKNEQQQEQNLTIQWYHLTTMIQEKYSQNGKIYNMQILTKR